MHARCRVRSAAVVLLAALLDAPPVSGHEQEVTSPKARGEPASDDGTVPTRLYDLAVDVPSSTLLFSPSQMLPLHVEAVPVGQPLPRRRLFVNGRFCTTIAYTPLGGPLRSLDAPLDDLRHGAKLLATCLDDVPAAPQLHQGRPLPLNLSALRSRIDASPACRAYAATFRHEGSPADLVAWRQPGCTAIHGRTTTFINLSNTWETGLFALRVDFFPAPIDPLIAGARHVELLGLPLQALADNTTLAAEAASNCIGAEATWRTTSMTRVVINIANEVMPGQHVSVDELAALAAAGPPASKAAPTVAAMVMMAGREAGAHDGTEAVTVTTGGGTSTAPPPPPKHALALLLYSDAYVPGAIVTLLSAAAAEAAATTTPSPPLDVALLLGCEAPPQHGFVLPQEWVPFTNNLGCTPMLSNASIGLLARLPALLSDRAALWRAHTRIQAVLAASRAGNWSAAAVASTLFEGDDDTPASPNASLSPPPSFTFGLGTVRVYLAPAPLTSTSQDEVSGAGHVGLGDGVWRKLHAWALTAYDCVLLLDSDAIVQRPLSHLFKLPVCAPASPESSGPLIAAPSASLAAPPLIDPGEVIVGLLLLRPSLTHVAALQTLLARHSSYFMLETTLLNWYFWEKKIVLPLQLVFAAEALDLEPLPPFSAHEVAVIDFSYCGRTRFKPWVPGPPPSLPGHYCRRPPGPAFTAYVDLWRALAADVLLRGTTWSR